ncbi:DISEASE RESISTANCE PROTEIN RP [Salix purpurea]|uniref:DISEASE RESISTANCE PROTEIN RP n=1 Tax=Salix purpurea TaxID=77065 RepID=A0A9Q0ZHZ4_SALPP|nr:DISEASE RESISTANCE PROTEIN RP [Salix purpurea]
MGGIGKPTPAKFVYDDRAVEEWFDLKTWAHVSQVFNALKLTKDTLKGVGLSDSDTMTPEQLHCELEKKGTRKSDAKQAIMDRLPSDDAKMKCLEVIAIVGMGGIVFDALKLTKNILKGVGLSDCDTMTPEQPHCELEKKVSGKKLLVVLDNVWSNNQAQWDFLITPLQSGARGRKFMVTTRNKNIMTALQNVSPYQLQRMSVDDCWRDAQQAIVDRLPSDDAKMKCLEVIAIVSIGGIGKTTLAKFVYDDRAGVGLSDCDTMTPEQPHCELEKKVSGKKLLVVLDNVWSDNQAQWDFLITPLQSGARGKYAFSGENCNARSLFEEAFRSKIVGKCDGLPLAARSLGRDAQQAIVDRLPSDDAKMKCLESSRGMVCFEIWAHVSHVFDALKLTKNILKGVGLSDCDTMTPEQPHCELEKKSGVRGSKIVVTTRNKNIMTALQNISPYQLQRMSVDDCWRDAQQAIVDRLPSDDAKMKCLEVIAIVGMGGIGKTTLAKFVCDDRAVEEWRDVQQAIVDCLPSDDAKMKCLELTKNILKGVGLSDCDTMTPEQPHCELEKKVSGKKLLVILDNVWSDNQAQWDFLITPLQRDAQQAIVDRLPSDDAKMKCLEVIAIVGMGGIGKTTLAKFVCDDRAVEEWRDAQQAIVDCLPSDDAKMKCLEGVGLSNCDTMTPEQPHCELEKKFFGKKLLVVLDNVWSDNQAQWDFLITPLQSGARGRKFMVTTRNKNIMTALQNVSPYQLQRMSVDDCWRDAQQAIVDRLPSDDAKMKCLEPHYELEKKVSGKKLLVVLDNVWSDNQAQWDFLITPLQSGARGNFVSRSFFEQIDDHSPSFAMHDLTNDLAKLVCGDVSYSLDDDDNGLRDISWRTRDVSFAVTRYKGLKSVRGINEVQNLLTFMSMSLRGWSNGGFNSEENHYLLPRFKRQQVLYLSGYDNAGQLLDSFGNLKHLQFLNLSTTSMDSLPEVLCASNRITRHATTDRHTEKAPIVDYFFIDASDSNLGGKRNLNALSLVQGILERLQAYKDVEALFIDGYRGEILPKWIRECPKLTRALPDHLPSLLELEIKGWPQLVLSLPMSPIINKMMLSNDYAEVKLVKLSFGYSLKLFSFQALHSLSKEMGKSGCDSTTLLSIDIVGVTIKWLPLMLFPRLKQLTIWACLNLESLCVQEEPYSNSESTSSSLICQSPHLEKLSLHNCPKLKSFHCFLPSLVNLKIYHNDGTKSFPRVGLSHKLESLKIQGCNKLLTSRKQWNLQRFPSLSRFCFGAPTLNPHLSWNP